MAQRHRSRSGRVTSFGWTPDDLHDYASAAARRPARALRRAAKLEPATWTVTDDWPDEVPVTEAEIEVFEAWFGDLFDELFATRH